jgi:hypothetical protein
MSLPEYYNTNIEEKPVFRQNNICGTEKAK